MKKLFKKYGHALLILYAFIYMPCFSYLESHVIDDYHLIHSPIDDLIPFCEFFIVPYLLWFFLIAASCIFFFFKSQEECIRMGVYMILGMSSALIIYYVYPNGLGEFRPTEMDDNIFSKMVAVLYSHDTSTNVLPSLHVYNTVVICIAFLKSKVIGVHERLVKILILILGFFICLSTVFLKQHSIYDVIAAFIMAAVFYPVAYLTFRKKSVLK